MTEIEGFRQPMIHVIGGNESRMSPVSTELSPRESEAWSKLFTAFLGLDLKLGQTQALSETCLVGIEFPIEVEEMPDSYCNAEIRTLFRDSLTHLPGVIEASIVVDGFRYMHGACEVRWEGSKPIPLKTQYSFANGNTQEDMLSVLELSSLTVERTDIPAPRRKLD